MTTTSIYTSIENNLAHYQTMTADQGQVKTASKYYQDNIGKVTSISQFVSNYRLLSYAMNAYGLGDQVDNKALITKVLQQGTSSSKALANTLENPAWKAFAKAFDFSATGAANPTSSASVATTTSDYTETQLEESEGQTDPGVQLALYFKRVAPTITSSYGILGDQNLLEVVQTVFGLSSTTSAAQIDAEAKEVTKLVPMSDLTDPKKLNSLVTRFTAAYDAKYGPASGNSSSLKVADGNLNTTTTAASSVLSQSISATAQGLSNYMMSNAISAGTLVSLAGLTLGG